MLRCLLKRKIGTKDYRHEIFETINIEVPKLEEALSRGGTGPQGFDITSLMGIEICENQPQKTNS